MNLKHLTFFTALVAYTTQTMHIEDLSTAITFKDKISQSMNGLASQPTNSNPLKYMGLS